MGLWTIEAAVGEEKKQKTFSIEEYVLPKFDVFIDKISPQSIKSDFLNVSVHAKYFYGKELEGKAIVRVLSRFCKDLVAEKEISVPGVAIFEMRNEIKEANQYAIEADVFENGTDVHRTISSQVWIQDNFYKGTINSNVPEFTQNEPFKIHVIHLYRSVSTPFFYK